MKDRGLAQEKAPPESVCFGRGGFYVRLWLYDQEELEEEQG